MAKIITADKQTGSQMTAADYNAFKNSINALYDAIFIDGVIASGLRPALLPLMEVTGGIITTVPNPSFPNDRDMDRLSHNSSELNNLIDLRIAASGGGLTTPSSPTSGLVDDAANTFNWTNRSGLTDISKLEFTINGGNSYNTVTAKPIVIGNVDKAIGQVGVREKAVSGVSTPSQTLYNLQAFTASGGSVSKTAKVSFNDTGNNPTSQGWNSILNSSLTTLKALNLDSGASSGWSAQVSRISGGGSNFEDTGTNTPGTSKFPVDVSNKTVYAYGGNGLLINVTGLDNSKSYNIYTFHATVDSGSGNVGDTKIIIPGGETKTTPVLSNTGTRSAMLSFLNVVPSDGGILMQLQPGPANALTVISAFIIEEI